jgi:hypothetical protein
LSLQIGLDGILGFFQSEVPLLSGRL